MSENREEMSAALGYAVTSTDPPNLGGLDGIFISMTGNHVVIADKDGKKHARTLAKDAQFTCDGLACEAQDVKAGRLVRVTTRADSRNLATGIESLHHHAEFAPRR